MTLNDIDKESPVLRVRDLSVGRNSRPDSRILDTVSLEIYPGEIVGLVGESGSGKTTLCRTIASLLSANLTYRDGSVELHGTEILTMKPKAVHRISPSGVSMVFQDPLKALNPVVSVGEQVREALAVTGASSAAANDVLATLMSVGLHDAQRHIGALPYELSGGQRQRVMIAIARAKRPGLLIADEPTSAVDVSTQAKILDLLVEIARDRLLGILLVSHDYGVIARAASRVIVLYGGQVVESGDTLSVLGEPSHPYTKGLIDSIPSIEERRARLTVIPSGLRTSQPSFCPFYSRCASAEEGQCSTNYTHQLMPVAPHHLSACVRSREP